MEGKEDITFYFFLNFNTLSLDIYYHHHQSAKAATTTNHPTTLSTYFHEYLRKIL
jgi:hypothetical protein